MTDDRLAFTENRKTTNDQRTSTNKYAFKSRSLETLTPVNFRSL